MRHVVLIELDVLLDTRIGILNSIDPELAIEVIEKGWRYRTSNSISEFTDKITDEEFEERWKNRTVDILPHSRLTNYVFEMATQAEQLRKGLIDSNTRINEPMFLINLYPYIGLTEEEEEAIVNMVEYYVGDYIPVKACYFKPSEIDLTFMKSKNILTYAVNDYKHWFLSALTPEKGQESIFPYPSLSVIAPAVKDSINDLNDLTKAEKQTLGDRSPFEILSIYWSPIFGLQFCPPAVMSLIDTTIVRD